MSVLAGRDRRERRKSTAAWLRAGIAYGFLLNELISYVGVLARLINCVLNECVDEANMTSARPNDKAILRDDLIAACEGDTLSVRVTPKASRNVVKVQDGVVRVYVTCVPEDGKATKEVAKLLAKALGVAKSNVTLLRGASSRDKQFQIAGL